ncbi:MAG: hypothetical protein E7679_06990 [Ruminococcaceae bacterium]|nr:hypothetical protein [Oscillospiraceae bacterium]
MTKVNSINVCPAELTLARGEWYYDASVSVCPENADCKEVTWSSDNTSVATVNPSTGYICAQGNGTTKIHATAADGSGCTDYICVTVKDTVPIYAVYIKDNGIRIEKGSSRELELEVLPENATNKTFTWHSHNPSVATVEDGVVYGVSAGSAQICVGPDDGGEGSGHCRIVEVTEDILVKSIRVSPSATTLRVGESAMLSATVCPTDSTNSEIRWFSTNRNIVTVNAYSGLLTAVGEGTAEVYAKSIDGGNVRCYCTVTVEKVPVTSVTINPSSKAMAIGSATTLTATVLPENATNKTVVWSVNAEDQNIITVNPSTGLVTAHAAGEANVWAQAQDGSGKYANCHIRVGTPVSKVTINPSSKAMAIGSTTTLTATVTPEDAINKTIVWSVNEEDQNIITVNPNTGRVTAHSAGEANVWAQTQDGSGEYMNCPIRVGTPVSKVTINPSSTIMAVGSTRTFTTTITPEDAINKDIVWSVNQEHRHIITVDPNTGSVTAHSAGEAILWAETQDGSGEYMSCNITVKNVSWEELGFSYDGSTRDFVRLNNDLPPYAYEAWLSTGYGYSINPYVDTATVNFDAIYVVDYGEQGLMEVGHAYLFLKAPEGDWIITEFAGPDKENAKVTSKPCSVEYIIEHLSVEAVEGVVFSVPISDGVSLSIQFDFYAKGVQFLSMKGDFSNSIAMAEKWKNQKYKGYYFLPTNNCLHYARDVLKEGTASNEEIEACITSSITPVPKNFYDELLQASLK